MLYVLCMFIEAMSLTSWFIFNSWWVIKESKKVVHSIPIIESYIQPDQVFPGKGNEKRMKITVRTKSWKSIPKEIEYPPFDYHKSICCRKVTRVVLRTFMKISDYEYNLNVCSCSSHAAQSIMWHFHTRFFRCIIYIKGDIKPIPQLHTSTVLPLPPF